MLYIKINEKVFDQFPNLESERLLFRAVEHKDVNDLFFIRSNDLLMKWMDSKKHQSIEDSKNWIVSVLQDFENKEAITWAIIEKESNEMIGYVSFWRMMKAHCRAEIGYALKPQFWRKGLMHETLNCIIPFAFNKLKLHSIEANVNPKNKSSKQLLLNYGFRQEAYFRENYLFEGKFVDSVIYSLLKSDIK